MSRQPEPSHKNGEQSSGRSPLGLGPLETAIMQALWNLDGRARLQDIRDSMTYHRPVAYNTTATVIGILYDKGLVHRELGDNNGHGPGVWWYRAAQQQAEHIGGLIAALLDYSPSPTKTLAHALATTRTKIRLSAVP